MSARIHPTALVEAGVAIGDGSSVWDNVHIRGPETTIGQGCIIGEKSYVAYGVSIGDLVKINAFVYVCTAVTIERGVMISAHATFTNDRFPRACTPDLSEPLGSEPNEETLHTTVCEGTTIGASAVIGPGLTLGRFSMIGMGSVVTKDVPDFALVVGNPARRVGAVCRCGEPVWRKGDACDGVEVTCSRCDRRYRIDGDRIQETSAAAHA